MKHAAVPAPRGVRINLLSAPTCLTRASLSFSFEAACRHTACRITMAEGRENAENGRYVYDSGLMETEACTGVTPAGLTDAPAGDRLCYARLSVCDASGEESPLSPPLPFFTATDMENTVGIWAADKTGDGLPDFAFFRHEMHMSAADFEFMDRAYLSVTAVSPEPARQYVYNMSVNGTEVGVGPCRLGKTPTGEVTLRYATYDVTPLLHAGINVLSAIGYTTAEHGFFCRLVVFDRKGQARTVVHSARDRDRWQVMDGDAVFGKSNSIGTHYFAAHACNVDATRYPFGFDRPDFVSDERWAAPVFTGDIRNGRLLLPDETEPVRRHPAVGAVTLRPLPDGATLVDLGAEIVGGLRLSLDNPTDAPVVITLDYAEQLTPDGTGVKSPMNTGNHYREAWTLKPGKQTLETLSMMAYRYVCIAGLPAPIAPADVCGTELRKDFSPTDASLMTDHALLGDLWQLTRHTVRVTTQDIYVDSQSRERGAYEGDLYINMLAAYAHESCYAPARLTADYLLGHRTWPADYLLCIIYAARADYMATGDTRLIAAWYDTLKGNLFTEWIDETRLVRSPPVGASSQNAVLVDWPPSERDGYDMSAPYNTVLNAMSIRAYEDMAAIAEALGKSADASEFRRLGASLRAAAIEHLWDADAGGFRDGLLESGVSSPHMAQHATAYALWAGLYTDAAMADRMAACIGADGKLHVSVYAAFFLLEGLYRSGHGELANRLMLDGDISDGARTWAYMLRRMKATVTTEAWNEQNKPNMTLSHPWGAAPAHMLAQGICGLIPTAAGYASVDIRPCFAGIDRLDATLPTIRGSVRITWQTAADGVHTLTVALPPTMTADVHLPNGHIARGIRGTRSWTGLEQS